MPADRPSDRSSRRRSFLSPFLLSAVFLTVLLAALFLTEPTLAPPASPGAATASPVPVSDASTRAKEGCKLVQTIAYERCGHAVTRRAAAPPELIGKSLLEVEPLYAEWRVTAFAPDEIAMTRAFELFCPDHIVLMSDPAGTLCVFRNTYGDALSLVRELNTPVSALPAAYREEARRGVGFADESELERWLESAES